MVKTPAKSVGNGGSLQGTQNFKMARNLVDHLSTTVLNNDVNVHKMLGMIEDMNISDFEKSFNNSCCSTPSPNRRFPNLISLFKSPEVTKDDGDNDPDLGSRLGLVPKIPIEQQKKAEVAKIKKGRPKFTSVLAWAAETSPVVYQTPSPVQGSVFIPRPTQQEEDIGASPKLVKDISTKSMLQKVTILISTS